MQILKLTFPSPINMSCRVGDTAWYSNTGGLGGFQVSNNHFPIGEIISIVDNGANTVITCSVDGDNVPDAGDFISFSKNNLAELSSIKGYYAEVTFVNNSSAPAELYASACGITESSK